MLITAIALLFDRKGRESVHTIALFSAAVLILMLDSYLFSIISGTAPPDDGDRRGICAIAWTQGAVATGMLAAGTTAVFGGLGSMLASHAVSKSATEDPEDISAYCFLADLGGWLTFASAMAMTLVLSETSIDYLHFMYGERPPIWVVGIITTSAALIIIGNVALVYVRTRALRRSLLDVEQPTVLTLRTIRFATIGMTLLAIIGAWLTMSINRFPKDWLTTPNMAVVIVVVVLTFVIPSLVATAICNSVASAQE
ncbi:hypothetical protein [Mycobacterium sp. SA01]|uniref:hypothetical protein n=1 Tax=Mycobacterium sp. SA01 TaxID=3238820 RepID=UPI00351B14C5